MSDSNKNNTEASASEKSPEPDGFFKRIFTKMDDAMKTKAEAQGESNCCSGDKDDSKGGKCC
jgi:hypothetical protein